MGNRAPTEDAQRYLDDLKARRLLAAVERPAIIENGVEALRRLVRLAQGDTGQCGVVAKFVLGLYNGRRFPFDLTELRRLDDAIFDDCMVLLRMDACVTEREVHRYLKDGAQLFERIAADWGLNPELSRATDD